MRILGLVLTAISAIACASLVSCSGNSGTSNTTQQYHYKLNENGCETEQSFNDKAAYCAALKDWKLNNGCASSLREDMYKKECGDDFQEVNASGPSKSTPVKTVPPKSETEELTYHYGMVIREIDAQNRAALFIFAPNKKVQELTQAVVPEHLNISKVEHGILNATSLDKMFNFTSRPLPLNEKIKLLKNYNGAVYLYVPQYENTMCDEQELDVSLSMLIQDKPVKAIFRFSAISSQEGTCDFHQAGLVLVH